jgi:vancomycin resistance protein YoaR
MAKPAAKPAPKRKTGARTALIILAIFMIGVAALVLSLGFYVDRLDTVFPNVWADGIKLSGMTFDEARHTLISAGYETIAEGVSATVAFPDGNGFTISGEEAGFTLNAEDAARAAFEFGRGGTFFENEITFVRALMQRTDLRDLSVANFDEEHVMGVVTEHTKMFNEALIDNAYDIVPNVSITVVKGTGVEPANVDSVFALTVTTLKNAMEEQAHLNAEYIPQEATDQEVDLGLLYATIRIDPIDAVYDPETFSATDSSTGISFDIEAAQRMLDRAGQGERVVIPLRAVQPEITSEYLNSMLFRDVLSGSSSRISGTSNRLANVALAAAEVNGTLLNPGDVFSFNNIVGQRTVERGFREAPGFISGRLVDMVGGGICQVSSTIYDAVLHADLDVVERRNHGMIIGYLPLGQDATVFWGTTDFRFRNNTAYPIRVETEITGRELSVQLIGTKLDDTYIKIDFVVISRTPFEIIERVDESVPQGARIQDTDGLTGYVVDTFKYLFDGDDNLISRTLVGRSSYRVQNRIILIPVPLPEDPYATDPDVTEPGTTDPGTTEPGTTEPGTTDPATTEPGTTEPGTTDPGTTDPGVSEPPVDPPGDPPAEHGTEDPAPTDPPEEPSESSRQEPD